MQTNRSLRRSTNYTYKRGQMVFVCNTNSRRALREQDIIDIINRKHKIQMFSLVTSFVFIMMTAVLSLLVLPVIAMENDDLVSIEIIAEDIIESEPAIENTDTDETITEEEEVIAEITNYEIIDELINNSDINKDVLEIDNIQFIRCDLPSKYYGKGFDFSTFQPCESYKAITAKRTPAYRVTYDENSYTDEDGFRRHKNNDNQFTINNTDDYLVALGTFYKTKGTTGERFLVITDQGMVTLMTGDEKSDNHTDDMHMFTLHNGRGAVIEWLADIDKLDDEIKAKGTIYASDHPPISGKIEYIYKIIE